MEELQIVYLSPHDLTPYEGNARKHSTEDVEQIKKSIELDGFNDPIGIWGDNNLIVEGHGRQIAAIQLGMKSVPCIRLDHLTDAQRRDYAIRHNRTAELSEWDWAKVESEIRELESEGMDLDGLDFDFENISSGGGASPCSIVEDDPPEPPEAPIAKLGDIWKLGDHRLMCGDSTSREDIKALMGDDTADLLLTDPPYGISVVKGEKVGGGGALHFGKIGGEKIVASRTYKEVAGDDTTETAKANYEIAIDFSREQVIFGGNYFTDFLPPSRCWVVWDKENTGNFADAELAWTSFDKGVKLYHFMWNGLAREGSRKVEGVSRVHPTQKPVGMLAYILNDFSEEGQTILDCFGGSGSTLIACEQTGRRCYMMELDPHYVDVIVKRWEDFTGEKAVLLNV